VRTALAIAIAALLIPGAAFAQTSTVTPVEDVYCITVDRDAFDYTDDPDALMEALLAGDVIVTAVAEPGACSADIAPAVAMTYEVWTGHIIDVYERIKTVIEAADDGDSYGKMLSTIRKMRDWAVAEKAYLVDAVPQDCWVSEFDDWSRGVEKVRSGTVTFLRAWSRDQYAAASKAIKTMTAGVKLLTKVNGSWLDECEAEA
jgi:hypothetical protein